MRLGLFFALVAVGVVFAQGTPKVGPAREQANSSVQKSVAPDEQGNSKVTVIVKQETAAPHDQAQEKASTGEDIQIQRSNLSLTRWLIGVGFIQAAILGLTIWAINRQTGVNQNIERAWVMAELRASPGTNLFTGTSTYQGVTTSTTSAMAIELYCVNDGNSPAWITEKSARLVVVGEAELPKTPQLTMKDVLREELEPLGPGRESITTWDAIGSGHHSTDTATIIYGVIKYTDIFKEKRETRFCYRLTGYRTNRVMTRVSGYPEYNRNT